VIGDGKTPQPHLAANPGVMLAPEDLTPDMVRPLSKNDFDWHPERSLEGPITILISGGDRTVYVYRNGNPIGQGPHPDQRTRLTGRACLYDAGRRHGQAEPLGAQSPGAEMDARIE